MYVFVLYPSYPWAKLELGVLDTSGFDRSTSTHMQVKCPFDAMLVVSSIFIYRLLSPTSSGSSGHNILSQGREIGSILGGFGGYLARYHTLVPKIIKD